MRRTQDIGRRGERIAARWLRRRGYTILARNVHTPVGEIDVLAENGRHLIVVEVKTTSVASSDDLEARIDRTQRERLLAAVRWVDRGAVRPWTVAANEGFAVRCDWMLVRLHTHPVTVVHLQDVFGTE